ncbi:hypothetical protein PRABACTJOHN_03260 [Parabacteroides johnsonii DSM 18315]|jgi:hypothetical protein|uniref:Conjugative transposon protein TraB n=1 Tax=Parabacteroides johnsonii DSM 18315 TaxID=537006 RepID=B7BDY5_9BACT|nr:DUF3408 domain-containing protein [Parabacteroides johnsonii]EEC95369.1 hypothetical protein PRABACTJOHN_03260 [Parabacteroides johnsonii DSM 18315]UEA89376.1 DUF3408 domain-containing protein [Parabacteroides johnsonii]UWP41540.1 DUF3408 domain-containing protein [Parabacteroides johnsonii DSM 18315]
MAKKLDVDIDPGKFLDSFRPEMPAPAAHENAGTDGDAPGGATGETEKVPAKAKKEVEYLKRFLHAPKIPVCSGKTAYIRKGYHERIQRIVQVIGKNGLTLSVYVDRVLEQHFREYEEVIRRLYKKNYEDIY